MDGVGDQVLGVGSWAVRWNSLFDFYKYDVFSLMFGSFS